MNLNKIHKIGAISLILGAVCLTAYSLLLYFFLPIDQVRVDFSLLVMNKFWNLKSVISLFGLFFVMFGSLVIYSKIYFESKLMGLISIIIVELAYLLQVSKVTWEIFIYPLLCKHSESLFLIKDSVLYTDPTIQIFRTIASLTILIGVTLFTITILKSKTFTKVSAILLFVGAVLYGIGPLLGAVAGITGVVIFSVGCVMLAKRVVKE